MPSLSGTPSVTLAGLRFPDDRSVLRRRDRRMIAARTYEGKEWAALKKLARPEDRVIEFGSGIGYLSTALARRIGVQHVTTFEANPNLIPFIRKVHLLNEVSDRVVLQHAIVTPEGGEPIPFYVRGNFLASSFEDNLGDKHGGVIKTAMVPQRRISDVVAEVKPSLLVCDIEGAESLLLPEMDFSTLRGAIVELHPSTIGLDGVKAIFDAFSAQGMAYNARGSSGQVVAFERL